MLFNSWEFLVFFPVVVLVYFLIPKKVKYLWLLVTSYYFYMCWNPKYILLIAFSTAATYASGLLLDGINARRQAGSLPEKQAIRRRKLVVAGCFLVNLLILAFFKYWAFLLNNFNAVMGRLGFGTIENRFSFVLPVGISFYTFQALSYTMDVYRGDIAAERNFFKYALFVSFFPQLVAGPIERSGNLLADIHDIPNKKLWDYDRITRGLTLMLYGMFLKLVIADRVCVFVDSVFDGFGACGSGVLWAAACGFALQIYCDFASYSTIAIGAAKVMGFTLMENFDTPYFARSIKEFWRRWHISLSTWFRDYLYIPLGGSRCSRSRRYFNLMVVFLVSGLWHGAGWHFVAWGCLHGLYQVLGDMLAPARDRVVALLRVNRDSRAHKLFQTLLTCAMVTVAWVLFRADTMSEALGYLRRMFAFVPPTGEAGLFDFGMDGVEWVVLLCAMSILFAFSLARYRRHETPDAFLAGRRLPVRWVVLYALLFGILIFGKYGPAYEQQAFIYFQF